MTNAPSLEDVFAVMSAASVGDATARVRVPDDPQPDDVPTRFGTALNLLLDDLRFRRADADRMADRLRILADASRTFAEEATDSQRLFDAIVRKVAEIVNGTCTLNLLTEDGFGLSATYVHARDPDVAKRMLRMATTIQQRLDDHPMVRHVVESGEAVLMPHIDLERLQSQMSPQSFEFARDTDLRTVLVVPLRVRGRSIGALGATRHGCDAAPFNENDLIFARNLADHAALAIANSRSYVAEQTARAAAEVAATELRKANARFVLDLTERKRAEATVEALRQERAAEAKFRDLLEAAPDAIVIVGKDGGISLVNGQTESLFGYSRSELLGQPIEILIPDRFRGIHRAHRDRNFADAHTRSMGARPALCGRRKDGTEFPAEISLSPIQTEQGTLATAVIRDITERTKADEHQFRLAVLVEASDDAIIGKTPAGIITSWNRGAQHLFGYCADEIVGKSISLLVPPERADEEEQILEWLARGETKRLDTVRRRKDGRDIDVSVTISPVRDSSGALIGASKVVRDITDRKHAEEALARAKDMAEAANRELEAFSYSVAHDLRAPLRGMNGFAQVLLNRYRDKLDAEGQDWLQEILGNATKMGELIDGLLSLARVTRGDLKCDRVDLSATVREAIAQMSFSDPHRIWKMRVQNGLFAMGDSRLLRILVENLVGNAWKFTSKVPCACIEFGAMEKDGSPAFFVRDNGAGFDMAFAAKLFAPFQRLHAQDEFAGTGIGLATVQRIIHRHGGRAWAEGAVDGGATFYFTFPGRTVGIAP